MTLSGAPRRVPAGPVAPRTRLADPRRRCRQLDLPVRFSALAFLREYSSAADLGYAIYLPDVTGGFHLYDTALAGGLCIMHGICGAAWVPAEVHFPHSLAGGHRAVPPMVQGPAALQRRVRRTAIPVDLDVGAHSRRGPGTPARGAETGECSRSGAPRPEDVARVAHAAAAGSCLGHRCRASAGDASPHAQSAPQRGGHHVPGDPRHGPVRGRAGPPAQFGGEPARHRGGAWLRRPDAVHASIPPLDRNQPRPLAKGDTRHARPDPARRPT